jgi:hypothetical protein
VHPGPARRARQWSRSGALLLRGLRRAVRKSTKRRLFAVGGSGVHGAHGGAIVPVTAADADVAEAGLRRPEMTSARRPPSATACTSDMLSVRPSPSPRTSRKQPKARRQVPGEPKRPLLFYPGDCLDVGATAGIPGASQLPSAVTGMPAFQCHRQRSDKKGLRLATASPAAMSGEGGQGRLAPSAGELALDGRGRSPVLRARDRHRKAETSDSGGAGARARSPRAARRPGELQAFARSWGCTRQIQARR